MIALPWFKIGAALAVVAVIGLLCWRSYSAGAASRDDEVAALETQLATSKAAERQREAETAQCVAAAKEQSEAIIDLRRRATDLQQASAKAIDDAKAKARQSASVVTSLQARAAAAPRAQSCEQTLKAADQIATDALRARR
jgi:hypothetical protein